MSRLSLRRGIASVAPLLWLCCAAQSLAQPSSNFGVPYGPRQPQVAQPTYADMSAQAFYSPPSRPQAYNPVTPTESIQSPANMPAQAFYSPPSRPQAYNPVAPVANTQPLPHASETNRPPHGLGNSQFISPPLEASYEHAEDFHAHGNELQPISFGEPVADCNCTTSGRYNAKCLSCTDRAGLLSPSIGGVHFGGWLQQGFTGNYGTPRDRMNAPVLFNDRSNDYQLNQLYLYAERAVCRDGCSWEIGGRIDAMLGTDARFLTVPGLEEHRDRTPKWNGETDEYGLAIPQAYVEIAAPWLNGVSLKAGHFYSIAGYETAAAPENFFYSHAYTYVYGEPFTFTGALFTVQPSDRVKLNIGYTNGWDVVDSTSDEYGILAGVTLTSQDQRTSLAATVHSGTDVTNFRAGGTLIDEDRHFYSLVLQHQINDCWRYVLQHDFGYQEDAEAVVNIGPRTITFSTGKWYGVNQYLIYDVSETTSAAVRVEWFRDLNNSRLGVPVVFNPGGPTLLGGNYFAVTGGLNWRPHSNVTVRPEIRWDYSDVKGNAAAPGGDPNLRVFDDNTSSSQVTAAVDVILFF